MKNKTVAFVAIGCGGVVVILLIAGILIVSLGFDAAEWVGHQIEIEAERQALADNWQPPADDASPETFFPPKVSGYALSTHDMDAAIPAFRFDVPGWHARYGSGESRIDVFVYQVSDLEREALFGRIEETHENDESSAKRITRMGYRCFYKSTRLHQNHFWWIKGWLLVFRTEDSEDREAFVREFLKTTTPPPPAIETDE